MRLSVIMLLLLLSMQLEAQHYTRDAGVRGGAFPAVCYRQYADDYHYSEVMLSLSRNAVRVSFLKEFAQPALQELSENLVFVYGFGAHSGFSRMDHYRMLNRTYFFNDYRFSPVFGIDGYLGLEYRFTEFPFFIGLDVKPFFEFSTTQFFSLFLNDMAFILKFKF
jgi:hypothetical protein